VVKFRRTGESARSEDETASGDHEVQIEGVRVGLEAVELDDGAAVPKEFANPTDGERALQPGYQPGSQAGAPSLLSPGGALRWFSWEAVGRAQGDTANVAGPS
jgi:hypothetical protein